MGPAETPAAPSLGAGGGKEPIAPRTALPRTPAELGAHVCAGPDWWQTGTGRPHSDGAAILGPH